MKLKSIDIENFGMYADPVHVDFPSRGLVLLTAKNHDAPALGANACGKSTLAEAIGWTLYGRTARGVRGRGIATWGTKSAPSVVLTADVSGEETTITRQFSPERIVVNGVDADPDAAHWLGITADEFSACASIPQDFRSFVDMTPAQRLELLSASLDIKKWDDAVRKAQDAEQHRQRRQGSFYERSRFFEGRASAHREALDDLGEVPSRKALQKKITELEQSIADIESKANTDESAADESEAEADKWRERERKRNNKLASLKGELRSVESAISGVEAEQREYRKKIKRIKRNGTDQCPLCKRNWKESDRGTLIELTKQDMDFQKKDAERHYAERDRIEADIVSAKKRTLSAAKRATEATKAARELRAAAQASRRASRDATQELAAAQEGLRAAKQHAARRRRLMDAVDDADRCADRAAEISEWVKRDAASAGEWIKRFKRLKLWIADQRLAELSEKATGVLGQLGMGEWRLDFAASRRSKSGSDIHGLHAAVTRPGEGKRITVPVEAWSGGEKQRLRIACASAVSEFIRDNKDVDMGFQIYDEPTAHLSREGVERLLDYLHTQARDRLIIVIDHRAPDVSSFDYVMTTHRRGGRVEEIAVE